MSHQVDNKIVQEVVTAVVDAAGVVINRHSMNANDTRKLVILVSAIVGVGSAVHALRARVLAPLALSSDLRGMVDMLIAKTVFGKEG